MVCLMTLPGVSSKISILFAGHFFKKETNSLKGLEKSFRCKIGGVCGMPDFVSFAVPHEVLKY